MVKLVKADEIEQYVGYEAPPTDWHTVTQAQIDQFADCTIDHQFIHVDPEKAKQTPFGSTIAHGFLTLSMLSHFAASFLVMLEGTTMAVNSGFDKVRFLAPVKVNKRIRALSKVSSIRQTKPGQFRVKTQVTIEIEGETTPALIAEWIGIQFTA